MKILVIQESDWIKRGPHQNHHLMERLAKRGHNIRVIDYELLWRENDSKERISKRIVFNNVNKVPNGGVVTVIRPPIIKLPIFEYISLLYSHRKEIKRQIEEFKPNVIIGWGILNAYVALNLAQKYGIPFVYFIIDELFRLVPQKQFWPLARLIESQNMKKSDTIISINEQLREYTIQMGAKREKTAVIRAGVNLERYDPNLSGTDIRNKYNIDPNDIVLFFMGWLYHFSGIKEVARELSKLKKTNNRIKFLIVGEGDAYVDLQKIRSTYQLEDQIILTGKQPFEKIPEYISAADICVLPAYPNERIMQNIVPIKMYEYMAMKKPVITTKLPGIMKEFGTNHGVIYTNQPETVLHTAVELVENDMLHEHGVKARRFVEKNSWELLVDKVEGIIENYL